MHLDLEENKLISVIILKIFNMHCVSSLKIQNLAKITKLNKQSLTYTSDPILKSYANVSLGTHTYLDFSTSGGIRFFSTVVRKMCASN